MASKHASSSTLSELQNHCSPHHQPPHDTIKIYKGGTLYWRPSSVFDNPAHLDLHGQLPALRQQRLRALRLVPVAVAIGWQLLWDVARQLLQLLHQAAKLVAHTVVLRELERLHS
jgi:hypothetical protein